MRKLLLSVLSLTMVICLSVGAFTACGGDNGSGGNNGGNGGEDGNGGTQTATVSKISSTLLDGKIANFLGAEGFGILDKGEDDQSGAGVSPSSVNKVEQFSLSTYDQTDENTQKKNEFAKHTFDGKFKDVHFHNADVTSRKLGYKDLNKGYEKHHHKGEQCEKTDCEDLSDEIEQDEQNGVSHTVLSLGARVNKLYNSDKFTFISVSSAVEGRANVINHTYKPAVDQNLLQQFSMTLPTPINIENHYTAEGGNWAYNLIEISNDTGKGYIPIKTNSNEVGYHYANYWNDDYNQSYIIDNQTGMTYSLSQFKYIYSVESGVIKVFNQNTKGWFDYYVPKITTEGITFDKVVFPEDNDFVVGIGSYSGALIDKFGNVVVANAMLGNAQMQMDEYGEKKYGENIILSYNNPQIDNWIRTNPELSQQYSNVFANRYRQAKRYHKGLDERIYRVDFRGNLSNVKVHVLNENCAWEEVSNDTTVTFENQQGYIRWWIGYRPDFIDCFKLNKISNGYAYYSTASVTDGGRIWDTLAIMDNPARAAEYGEYVGVVKISVNGPDEQNSHLTYMYDLSYEGFEFDDRYTSFLVGDTQVIFWREGTLYLWDVEKDIKKEINLAGLKINGMTNDNVSFAGLGYISLLQEVDVENLSENTFSSTPVKIGGELDAYFKLVKDVLN